MGNKSTELLREKDVAEILNISARTLQNWRYRGGGPVFVRLGRSIRYQANDLQNFICEQRDFSDQART